MLKGSVCIAEAPTNASHPTACACFDAPPISNGSCPELVSPAPSTGLMQAIFAATLGLHALS